MRCPYFTYRIVNRQPYLQKIFTIGAKGLSKAQLFIKFFITRQLVVFFPCFLPSFNKYVANICYMPDTVLCDEGG